MLAPTPALAHTAPSELPPEARAHNNTGVALVAENRLEEAVAELQAAYDAMPDPLVHRAGRGKVLGSLRGVLLDLHAASADPRHLCRLRVLLTAHLEALERAQGPSAQAPDIQGIRIDLYENNLALARAGRSCEVAGAAKPVEAAPPPVVTAAPVASLRPSPTAMDLPRPTPGRRLQIAGGVLTATGVASLAVMAYGIVVVADARGKIEGLTATLRAEDRPPTSAEEASEAALYRRGSAHHTLAIATGVLGGVAVLTGVALLAKQRRQRHARFAPVFAPRFTGASFYMRF